MALKLSTKEYFEKAYKELSKEFPKENALALPKIDKVVINAGVGKFEKSDIEEIAELLENLAGQKVKKNSSNVSIAGFKLRAGEVNGLSVTLRGQKMRDFIMNMVHLSLPRTKDFKGLKPGAFDKNYSCYSVGIPNASIFPQVGFGVKKQFGVQVNITFKDSTENNKILLDKLGFPFKKKM